MDELQKQIIKNNPDYSKCLECFLKITEQNYKSCEFPNEGVEFEYLMVRLFELSGLQVSYSIASANEQIDGVIHLDQIPFLVESKKCKNKIDIEPIAKLMSRLQTRPSFTMGLIISLSGITSAALEYMKYLQPRNIIIFQGTEIELAIKNSDTTNLLFRKLLEVKLKALIERSEFDYHLKAFLEDIQ